MGVSRQLLLTLIALLIFITVAQAQFTGCFTDPGCTALVVGGPSSSAEDCCVNNNAGLYYNNGGQCFQCIVYGFGSDSFTRPEAQFPYDFPFGYFKGPSNAQLRVAIDYNGEGTALEGEFGIGQSVVSLPLNPGGTTSITFQADRVALEPDETFVLDLVLLNVANVNRALFESSLPNVFFRSRQEFTIQDSTALVFRLRESDRVVDEGNRFIPVEVTVANEVELASDISLVLTPMIATEDFRPLPTTSPNARANTFEGRIDFFTTPITLNFTAGREIFLAGDVLIYDDLIDEALEYFVVTLTFQDPDNVPPLASIERDGGDIIRIDIIDNDDIFIGFALPNTTYPEIEADYQIQIIKGAGNVTEQTISFVVNLFQNAPPGLGTATPSAVGDDNDFSFPSSTLESIEPEENDVFVDVIIFGDALPEVTEAAQLRSRLPTDGMFPGFETLPQYPEFFIIIEDDDRFRIGFERTSYIVNEGIGMQEVCVVMFEPPENTPLGTLTVSIGVETVRGTADGDDYTEVTGARFAHFLFFSDTSRRSCFMVEITEDNRYEFEEQFSLRFIELEGTTFPDNLVLDPARSNITIVDNEEVTVGFINPPYSAREDEGPMIFTVGVTSDHILERDIELSFSTVDGLIADFAAMAGLDYTSIINMPIILSAGMQSIETPVDLNPDQLFENNETFQGILTIISGERVSLSPGTADATIINEEVVCQELELLVNGSIEYSPDTTAPYLEGTNAEHICSPGFILIGNVIRVCQSDSTFSGVPPMCQPIQCNPLDGIENGLITYAPDTTPNYDLGTVATYACDAGFVLDLSLGGSETRTCVDDEDNDAEGVFSGQAPRCIRIECPPLDPIINGVITYAPDTTSNYDLDTLAFHVCNPGFLLDLSQGGSTFRTCADDDGLDAIGDFDNQAPRCIRIECPTLDPITNGVITYAADNTPNYTLSTVATYDCDAGFFLDLSLGGSEMRTCVDDDGLDAIGEFNNQAPRCIPIECLPLDPITNGFITYAPDTASNYDLGTVATYDCDSGFVLDLSLGGSEMRTCMDDNGLDAIGVFDRQTPRCIAIECRVLPVFTNGMIVYATDVTPDFDVGTTATYSCNNGYTLDTSIGVEVRTCIDDGDNDAVGVFSDQEPACVLIQCTPLPDIPNGRIKYGPDTTANYMLGTTSTYICNNKFFLDLSVGNQVRTCEDDNGLDDLGEFTGSQPTCVRPCDNLPPLFNGMITYNTSQGLLETVATYTCNDGFTLLGSHLRICEEGVWEEASPSCLQDAITPSGAPMIGRSFSLLCTVTETDSLQLTISYYWFRGQLPFTTNSGLLTFDTLFLSDAGLYRCEVTVSSDEHQITVNSSYDIDFKSLHIQLRLIISSNCGAYTQSETTVKTSDITNELSHRVDQLCQCGFNTSLISRPFIRCFENSPNHVTYRAVLSSSETLTIFSFIDRWSKETPSIIVQSAGLRINSTCPVIIANPDSPECPEDLTNRTLIITVNTDNTPLLSVGTVIGIVIGSLALIVALLVIVILLVALRYQRYKSKTLCFNESNPPDLDMKPETVPDELPDHDYDYISVFQEANLKGTSGNPQPSVSGDGASEVQFELTPCDAYGPGNPQPSTAGDDASEIQIELTSCDTYEPVTVLSMQNDS